MSSNLEGKVVAIAGAGGGLGPVVASLLAEEGATIAATDVEQSKIDALASQLGLPDERFDGHVVDLLDEGETRKWAAALEKRFSDVYAVLHLVGGWKGGEPLPEAPLADYEWLHDLLVRTLQHVSRAFHGAIERSSGRFVVVSSTQAQKPEGTNASYAAAKAAAESWTLALADSLKESGATANIVVVNAILTPAMRDASPDKPFRIFTSTEDIAQAISYLLSPAAAKMSGERLELHP